MSVQFKPDQQAYTSPTQDKAGERICDICTKPGASYSCPRCNISYCSLACYRDQLKHLKCSENFYEEQVIAELKMCKLSSKGSDKNKMVEILKKVSKEFANEKILLPGCDYLDDSNDSEKESGAEEESEKDLNDNHLIKAYENVIIKWKPVRMF